MPCWERTRVCAHVGACVRVCFVLLHNRFECCVAALVDVNEHRPACFSHYLPAALWRPVALTPPCWLQGGEALLSYCFLSSSTQSTFNGKVVVVFFPFYISCFRCVSLIPCCSFDLYCLESIDVFWAAVYFTNVRFYP